jgi:hypothetical protein
MAAAARGGLALLLLAPLIGASCTEVPLPRPAPPRPDTPPPAPVALPAPARWVESRGATLVGPAVDGGTLVLLGGRRAIVAADGAVRIEGAPYGEALEEIVLVPSAAGTRVVAHGAHEVVRLDDPLGVPVPLARSELPIARIGAGPGVVAVWTGRSDVPRFLDVATGKETAWRALPAPPLHALAFLDEARGAGVFEAIGLAVTTDGGATWRPVAESAPRDALRVAGIRRRGDALRAYAYADGPDGAVDPDRATLGPLEPPHAPAGEPATLRWIRATGRDPLEAAAGGGLELPAGLALVASHGMIARVDPRTGAVDEIVELGKSRSASPCAAARAGKTAWIACALSQDFGRELFDPFGVMHVALGDGKLAPDAPVVVRNGETELHVSPSGGVMLAGPCKDESGQACVRQPDGKWRTINADDDLEGRAMGPLADGRVAFLRGLFDGDVPASPADGADRARGLHVATLGADGVERALPPIGFSMSRGHVRAQSPIEEDVDHALRFVIEDGEGPFAVVVPPSGEPAEVKRVPDAAVARVHAGRGIAVGEGHVLASLDGGSIWDEVPAPPAALDAATAAAVAADEPDGIALSETGARVGPMLRLGWGPPEPVAPPPPAPPPLGPTLPAPARRADPPGRKLVCKSLGPSTGAPLATSAAQAREVLAGKATPPPAGTRRESSVWSLGAFDARALLEEEGPDGHGSAPATWTLRWYDAAEPFGRPRSATFPAPRGATWGTSLRFAAASAGRALFLVRTGGKSLAVRVKAGQRPEIAEVSIDLTPAGDVVFGEEKGEPIVWAHNAIVAVWLAGEKPRAIAELATRAYLAAGEPTQSGVPILLESEGWSLMRVVPIPPLDKAAPDRAPKPLPLSLEGFAPAEPLRARLATLPPCAPRAKGARFVLRSGHFDTQVDGVDETGSGASFVVRVAGADACVDAVAATLAPDRRAAVPAGMTPAGFVRADVVGKRAEGGDRGVAPAAVRRMKCELVPQR